MKADIVLKSQAVFTGLDEEPFQGAVAIHGNKILAAGCETEINKFIGTDTRILDFGERLIMPGFIDAHFHLFYGALFHSEYVCTDIFASASEEECVKIIQQYAAARPDDKRILGMGWFLANWESDVLPSKKSLDAAFPDKPVYLINGDGHTFWMNTKALEESGITPAMKVRSGEIGVDDNGELTGLLFEPGAYEPAISRFADMEQKVLSELYKNLIETLSGLGITSLIELTDSDYNDIAKNTYKAIKKLEDGKNLNIRVHIHPRFDGYKDFSDAKALQNEFHSEKIRISGVKGLIDGVTSTYTAYLNKPYADKPDTNGLTAPLISKENLEEGVIAANKAGLPVKFHAVGDGAVTMALDAFEASLKVNGKHGLPNSIEHIENIIPSDIERFRELGVVASFQPSHLIIDHNEKLERLGSQRCNLQWPIKSILDSGAVVALGTDFPIVDFNPFTTIQHAVTRQDDEEGLIISNPEQKLTLAEALKAYTFGSAVSCGRSDVGVLAERHLADVIVVDRNLFEIDINEIQNSSVNMVMVDGQIIHENGRGE